MEASLANAGLLNAGLHWFSQLNLVFQSGCCSLGASYGAVGHHPQAGCQPNSFGKYLLPQDCLIL